MKRKRIATYGRRGQLVRVFDENVGGRRLVRVQWNETKGAPLSTESWPYSKQNVETAKGYAQGVDQRLSAGLAAPIADRTLRQLADLHIAAFSESWAIATLRNFRHRWSRFEAFAGRNTSARLITEESLDEFRASMRATGIVTNQRTETIKAVKQLFRWARRRKLIAENPIADYTIKLAKAEKVIEVPEWSPDDTARLGARLLAEGASRSTRHWRLEVGFFLAASQGPRINALLHLAWDDINLSGQEIRHPSVAGVVLPPRTVWWNPAFEKTGAERVQPLTRGAVRALRISAVWRRRLGYEGPWVFAPARLSSAEKGEPWGYASANHALRELCDRCEPVVRWVKGRAFHGFRKFSAGEIHRLTGSERSAADWLGDKDVKVVRKHYLKRRAEEQRDVAQKIDTDSALRGAVTDAADDERAQAQAEFWARVARSAGCWEWTGDRLPKGYGYFYDVRIQPGIIYAHRFALEASTEAIPDGFQACHTCDNPPCCRPDHLFPGTVADNLADMRAKGREGDTMPRKNARKTHCKRGHEFTPENTRWNEGQHGPQRQCITCDRERPRPGRSSRRRGVDAGAQAMSQGGVVPQVGLAPGRRKPIEHGTRTGYGRGCRCEPCTAAQRDHIRAVRGTKPEHFKIDRPTLVDARDTGTKFRGEE